jgi:hypothetical protein
MKNLTSTVLILSISLLLSGCGVGQIFGPTITPIPTATDTPTATFTPAPTFTPTATPDFYTSKERLAEKITWVVEEYNSPTAGTDGSVLCMAFPGNKMRPNSATFTLPEPGKDITFYGTHFIRTSPNLWTNEYTDFQTGGVTYKATLVIAENQVTETWILYSPSGDTKTCINLWKPQN